MNTKHGIFLAMFGLLVFCAFIGIASATTIYVPDDYANIQWAVDNASDGATIIVKSGTYYENVNVYRRLTLRGMDTGGGIPVVNAGGSGNAIALSADGIAIEGIEVTNAFHAGIGVTSNNNIITGNNVSNNYDEGISLSHSCNNTITGNNVSNNYYGIYLHHSSNNNIIIGNNVSSNYDEGISLSYSCNNTITGNNVSNNYYGIYLHHSSNNNIIIGNNVSSNYDEGISLSYSCNNTITGNNVSNNYYGINLYLSSNNNIIIGNNVSSNYDEGISLSHSCNNLIYNNYFNNTNNAYDDGNNAWNITKTEGTSIIGGPYLGGNYWSDYAGADTDGDELGDTLLPYNSGGNIMNDGDWLPLASVSETHASKSEIHVHKKEYLSTYDTHIDHNKIYDFTPEWSANVWDVENLDNVTYTITTSKNFTYIDNWERYQDGTENTFILPPTVEGENYTWILPLKDRVGSNINFVLDSSQTIQDNPWVDVDVNTTKEDGYERVNVTFTPVVPLDWINLYVRGNQIIDVSAYPPEFEIEMLTSSYVEFDSGNINQGYVYNFSVLVDNHYEVELELYASFGWEVESPSNLITLPVAELGSVTVEADVPVIWEHTPTLPESVQSIAIEFEEEKGFDTEEGTYPSIMGTHKGEIKPSYNINVSKLYTYPCAGTGGHTESIKLYENDILIASGTWNGYQDDYHNITITPSVILQAGHTYNYTIVTGSYPQIIHEQSKDVTGGTITCTSFVDANGKTYTDWIPAIRLE